MVSLRQKLKMPKRCEKRLDDHITVVVCKKALKKTAYIRKCEHFQNAKNGHNAKAIAHAKYSVWVKK